MKDDAELVAALRSMGRASVPPEPRSSAKRSAVLDAMVTAALQDGQPESERLPAGVLGSAHEGPAGQGEPGISPEPMAPGGEAPLPGAAGRRFWQRRGRAPLLGLAAAALAVAAAALVVISVGNHGPAPAVSVATVASVGPAEGASVGPGVASVGPARGALLGEGGAYVHAQAGEVVVIGAGGLSAAPSPDASGHLLLGEDRVATLANGRATIHLGSIVVVALSPHSELVVAPASEPGGHRSDCELRGGTAQFEVAKLPKGVTFSVKTPDAEITVHGTSFRVSVGPPGEGGGPRTQVAVTDGVVSVESPQAPRARLVAGDRWPAPAALASASPPGSTAAAPRPAGSVAVPRSDLAAQNALLTDALSARRRGDGSAEARALDAFIARYPRSPGAHDAIVNRMRVAVRSGDGATAAREARRYLQMFPAGPLREEAQAAVARGKP
jgi:ferric-dicitrate binding protein FerR (iron transport regulator)